MGVIFTSATFFINIPALVNSNQTEFIQDLDFLKTREKNDLNYVKDNFIFIDNSYCDTLIRNVGTLPSGSSIEITDRKVLTKVLASINTRSQLTDLLVCDMFFDLETTYDTLLRTQMLPFRKKNALLIGKVSNRPTIQLFVSLGESVFGEIEQRVNDGQFTVHFNGEGQDVSLPYRIYEFTENIKFLNRTLSSTFFSELNQDSSKNYCENSFIPSFSLTDETVLYPDMFSGSGELKTESSSYFRLSSLQRSAVLEELLNLMQRRHKEGKKNFLFVGNFKGDKDVHRTVYGKLHGSTILLNVFLSYRASQHLVKPIFVFSLMIIYTLLFFVLCLKLFNKIKMALPLDYTNTGDSFMKRLINASKNSINVVFLEEIHLWLMVALIAVIFLTFGKIINGLFLLTLIAFINKVLSNSFGEQQR